MEVTNQYSIFLTQSLHHDGLRMIRLGRTQQQICWVVGIAISRTYLLGLEVKAYFLAVNSADTSTVGIFPLYFYILQCWQSNTLASWKN